MKNKKNWFKSATMLILAASLVLAAGCSSNGSSKPKNTGVEKEVAGESSGGFKLWVGWSQTVNNNSLVQQYWKTEEPGVDVQVEATQGDSLAALNLKLNTGGFEDAALFGRRLLVNDAMKRSKLILPLEQYFNMPDKYPNLAKIPKVYLDQMKDADGHIWSIPGNFAIDPTDPFPGYSAQAWFVRTEILEQAGMTVNDLTTLSGVESFLVKAAQMKDESGKPLLPLGLLMDASDENTLLNTFGVTTGTAGGVTAVQRDGDQFIFKFDSPGFKEGFKWMNSLYSKGLLDPEVVTDKVERFKEKTKSGRYAMTVGSFWNLDSQWVYGDWVPVPFPKVEGVNKPGTAQVINPYPQFDTYISKNTKNLDAILKFYDYALNQEPDWMHVINEGPSGKYWDWVNEPLGKWKFIDPQYNELRNSGDNAKVAQLTPQLAQITARSKEWYPWWNQVIEKEGDEKPVVFSQQISKFGAVKVAENQDMVTAKVDGVWEKYASELEVVYKEYRAKLLMAENDAQFEKTWNEFTSALEKRAHWSELKQEWNELYQAMD
ncbi:hypothetical protein FHS19_000011 [Paenibacillus rhizosphaerae]|uniref:ABC transporter substrate-binding protein n=1 Tax=Paenibacillus rhizosphaerae TaxID=297318 RepID=A0A839TKL0_9BACL|nr:hypothetical protein [Paenibacillus rhizosphaerae]MBB3125357.1 hypothetical protein [Paenibacillus rhizosphaerae]